MDRPLGVGIIGPGRAAQAVHLPALARLPDRLRVVHVMGPTAGVAAAVARGVGARHSTTAADLLTDPAVDVVAVCSPQEFHAAQVEAACAAGKRAVLCEKPIAVSAAETARVVAAARQAGTQLVAGTMHLHDPAVVAAQVRWSDLETTACLVRSVSQLPHNFRFEQLSTQLQIEPGDTAPESAPPDPATVIRGWILGLAIHTVPLLRRFLGRIDRVETARLLQPYGYLITLVGETGCRAQLIGYVHDSWKPQWTFEAWGPQHELAVHFPPSYVQAGSAVAELRAVEGVTRWGPYRQNAHTAIWSHLADVAEGSASPRGNAPADMLFTLQLADEAGALVNEAVR